MVPFRCDACTWIEVGAYGDVTPRYIVERFCPDHRPPPTDREIAEQARREAWAELDAIERTHGLTPG